jgi:hypothetical protein
MIRAAPGPHCAPVSRRLCCCPARASPCRRSAPKLRVRLFPRNACRADCSLAPPRRCEVAAQGALEGAVWQPEIERSERAIDVIKILIAFNSAVKLASYQQSRLRQERICIQRRPCARMQLLQFYSVK